MYKAKPCFRCGMPSDAPLPVGLGFREAPDVMGGIVVVPSWMGFTLPPECTAFWVGEVGQPTSRDGDKRRKNLATMHMARNLAQNLVYYARLLNAHPQTPLPGKAVCCEAHAGLEAPGRD